MRNKVHQQVYLYGCLGMAFMLPVWGKLVPTIIVILLLNWIVSGDYIRTVPELFRDTKRRNTLAFALLYFLYLAGLLYTTDFIYAGFDLEVKLSLLIFPLIFATADVGFLNPGSLRTVMKVYVAGCFAGSMILFIHAFILWREGVEAAFYYTSLGWYYHASYYAMYLNFAIAFIILELIPSKAQTGEGTTLRKTGSFGMYRIVLLALLLWFFVFIFLLSSKMGLIGMVVLALLASCWLVFGKKMVLSGVMVFALFCLAFFSGTRVFSVAASRMEQGAETLSKSGKPEKAKSTADRIEIWKVSFDIIRANPLIGVGTGDVKDVLIEKYQEKNIKHALEYKLNAHNQYLQTFMTLGFPGFLTLLLMLFLPSVAALRRKQLLYFAFLLLFAINISVESMFETQAGVVWYAFFNMVLFCDSRKKAP